MSRTDRGLGKPGQRAALSCQPAGHGRGCITRQTCDGGGHRRAPGARDESPPPSHPQSPVYNLAQPEACLTTPGCLADTGRQMTMAREAPAFDVRVTGQLGFTAGIPGLPHWVTTSQFSVSWAAPLGRLDAGWGWTVITGCECVRPGGGRGPGRQETATGATEPTLKEGQAAFNLSRKVER